MYKVILNLDIELIFKYQGVRYRQTRSIPYRLREKFAVSSA